MITSRFSPSTISRAFMPRRPVARATSLVAAALAGIAASGAAAGSAGAQPATTGFEVRPYVGAYIPTGDHRDLLKDALLVGVQGSWRVIPQFVVTGNFAWSPNKDRVRAGDQTLDIFQYDVGAELRAPAWYRARGWDFTPFVGLGAGARTYDYRDLEVDAKTNFAGYGAVGGDLGFGPVALRVEARDYLSQFKPFTAGGDTKTRNDVALAVGLSYRF